MEPIVVSVHRRRPTSHWIGIFTIDASTVSSHSWTGLALDTLCRKSAVRPLSYTTAFKIQQILQLLSTSRYLLCTVPAAQLGKKRGAEALRKLESDINQSPRWSTTTKVANCQAFRWLLNVGQLLIGECPASEIILCTPRQTRHPRYGNHRARDTGHISLAKDPAELERSAREDISGALNEYVAAAERELNDYAELCHLQDRMQAQAVERYGGGDREGRSAAASNAIPLLQRARHPITSDEAGMLLALYEETINDPNDGSVYGLAAPCPEASRMPELPLVQHYRLSTTIAPWWHARFRLPNAVLTAIYILLLARTAWNISSIGDLTLASLCPTPHQVEFLKSRKTKTDDDTPLYHVEKTDSTLRRAIALLVWNLQQLKEMGLVSQDEERLWFGWQRDHYKTPFNPVSVKRLQEFKSRQGLTHRPLSSLRNLRAQSLYLEQGDIQLVRQLLGHRDLLTTLEYLAGTVIFRLNQQLILRFQQELDHTLVFLADEKIGKKRRPHVDLVNIKLLVRTGDGGYCDDPCDSPSPNIQRTGAECDGLWCHAFGRCKHYKLTVTADSLLDAARTFRFYADRWSDLLDENPDRFHKIHIPRLLFLLLVLGAAKEREPDMFAIAMSSYEQENHET